MSVLLWILAVSLIRIGLAGIVFPGLPGTVLIVAGLLRAAWADGFMRVGKLSRSRNLAAFFVF